MTPKEKKERRHLWWKERLQVFRLWIWCVIGGGITLALPNLKAGIVGVAFYIPNVLEVCIALGLAVLAVTLDAELGGDKLCKSRGAWIRKRKHALLLGIGILGWIDRLTGGA